MNELIDIGKSLQDRILTKITLMDNSFEMQLNDIVFLYNDNRIWKAVPLKLAQMYPIIYDSYYENEHALSITVYICPYTLFSCVYFDELTSYDKVYNNNLALHNKKKDLVVIPILNNVYDTTTNTITNKYIRKNEIKIMTIRNAISLHPDCKFISLKDIEKKTPLVEESYLFNNTILFKINKNDLLKNDDPKTLIYVIEYKSKKTYKFKYTVIIPRKNVYDRFKNGFQQYVDKMGEKITEKGGIIYSCLWFAWISTYPTSTISKIIKL